MRKGMAWATVLLAFPVCALAQQTPPASPVVSPAPPRADTSQSAPKLISLDEAIRLALQHNHALLAAQSTILQN
ncbi:MAG: hypothetical protein ACRD51_14575, partial [Candidatus Acidiferrum sp.]